MEEGTNKKGTGRRNKSTAAKEVQTAKNQKNLPQKEKDISLLEEPIAEYSNLSYKASPKAHQWVILNEAAGKPESRMTTFEKIDLVKEGISKKDLENLKEKADLDYNQLAKVLSVARATLINKKGKSKFDTALSERIVGVADIYSYGYEVFEDEARFNEWIFRSNKSLGGKTPYDLLDSQYGREEVKSLIGRIDYGVYS